MKVIYLGLVRNTLDMPEEEVEVPVGSRVRDLLYLLQSRHGDDFRNSLFTKDGRLRPLTRVFIGAKGIEELDGLDTPIGCETSVYVLLLDHPGAGG